MKLAPKHIGLIAMILSAISFGTSGAFIKPLLEAGWSPAAAVTVRALTGSVVLLPFVLFALRGRWSALWRARWRVLGMGVIAVAFTQLTYFAAISRIPVSTALLIEYLAPLLLVLWAWATTRRLPRPTVLLGSVLAVGGLVLVIGPGALQAVDPLGLLFAFAAAIGCAVYFVVAARPSDGLPPVALAGSGLLLGGLVLALAGLTGAIPFRTVGGTVPMLGVTAPWWVPLGVVAVAGTAIAYATGIAGSSRLGSRLASFLGLLEVVFASIFAWLVVGESLTVLQMLGGALILAGIATIPGEQPTPTPTDQSSEPVPAVTGQPSEPVPAGAGQPSATLPAVAGEPSATLPAVAGQPSEPLPAVAGQPSVADDRPAAAVG